MGSLFGSGPLETTVRNLELVDLDLLFPFVLLTIASILISFVSMIDLKKALYALFCQFGPILDVVAMKSPKMRGQAFIVYRDLVSAGSAIQAMQSFVLFDKPMVPCYIIIIYRYILFCIIDPTQPMVPSLPPCSSPPTSPWSLSSLAIIISISMLLEGH